MYHVRKAQGLVRGAYRHLNWRDEHPVSPSTRRRWRRQRACVGRWKQKHAIDATVHRQARSYRDWAEAQRLQWERRYTPYDCGSPGWFAIPCPIVRCESGYSWSAANSSGAQGPYQLLGHGQPWPIQSRSDKDAHHRIAAALWDGGRGQSNWDPSDGCSGY